MGGRAPRERGRKKELGNKAQFIFAHLSTPKRCQKRRVDGARKTGNPRRRKKKRTQPQHCIEGKRKEGESEKTFVCVRRKEVFQNLHQGGAYGLKGGGGITSGTQMDISYREEGGKVEYRDNVVEGRRGKRCLAPRRDLPSLGGALVGKRPKNSSSDISGLTLERE